MSKINLNKAIVIVIIAALAIGGAVYWATNSKEAKIKKFNENYSGQEAQEMMVNYWRAIADQGKNLKCSVTQENITGTVYISSSGNLRGDFVVIEGGGSSNSSIIVKGEDFYSWNYLVGSKRSLEKNKEAEALARNAVKGLTGADFTLSECEAWVLDDLKFVPPANVEFWDWQEELKNISQPAE